MKLAYCGINCESCKLYKATITNDNNLRKVISEEWGLIYKKTIDISTLNCLGCKSELHYVGCGNCDITICNQKRNNESCNECSEYSNCDRIKKFIKWQKDNNTEIEILI